VWSVQEISQRAAQNSHGHAKEFLRKLSTISARALKKVRQPWARVYIKDSFRVVESVKEYEQKACTNVLLYGGLMSLGFRHVSSTHNSVPFKVCMGQFADSCERYFSEVILTSMKILVLCTPLLQIISKQSEMEITQITFKSLMEQP
jgi:hypothetical protein